MGYENILYEKKDGIAYITFNRPKVLNALNRKTVEELRHALLDARDDSAVRVLILTGAGEKAFVAGADIGELALQTPVNGKGFSLFGQGVFHLLETMGKPSICAINGFALGGGCELALSCTIRIASKTAKLGQPEVKLGILPGYGGTQRLARLCGKGVAHELCLTGEMITAEEAQRIGLVNPGHQPAELSPAAESEAEKLQHGKISGELSAAGFRFGIAVSRFNSFITERLLAAAVDVLDRAGAASKDVDVAHVPGAFELPLAAKKLAATGKYDALIAIGCVLRGETTHYDYVCSETARGLQLAQMDTGLPIIFGVLTCDTLEQAIDRAGLKGGNKGFEAGLAAIEMAQLSRKLRSLHPKPAATGKARRR